MPSDPFLNKSEFFGFSGKDENGYYWVLFGYFFPGIRKILSKFLIMLNNLGTVGILLGYCWAIFTNPPLNTARALNPLPRLASTPVAKFSLVPGFSDSEQWQRITFYRA